MSNRDNALSPTKQALLKIRELKKQLASAEQLSGEPIAIVSMACRFPRSSDSPEKFWQSLLDQTDQVSEIPIERWDRDAFHDDDPDTPGKMYADRGCFLDAIDQMDPEFFGISPREATWIDPQQRLLMEVGWEAIERAGWVPEQIGDHTGVFVGWMHNDYQNEASDSFLNLNPYIATGAAGSFLCGRLAYYLGLQGPSVAVDTACSSSLVALHLAIQSLQRRDCDRALVGGVNAICSPTTNILTCKLKALSPNGHSRAFDASADGYLRGEGCGVVALRRLNDAHAEGDQILGIIRGSSVGHNGFSSGLTAPNPKAQEKVIRAALRRADVAPEDILYLEAHGTGTELGDPIELNAAAAALGGQRTAANPLLVGSVKTNIGHLEAAAGMAGLIKVLLAMQHNCIPGQLNFETPNPHIPWDKLPVKILTDSTPWPERKKKIAGVSAFGMSGTNAHVVIEAPAEKTPTATQSAISDPQIVVLSAKNETALLELANNFSSNLNGNPNVDLSDIAYSSGVGRSHFEYRAAVVSDDVRDIATKLATLARGSNDSQIYTGHGRRPRIAWQFTGQGSQYVSMGLNLYQTQPIFRQVIDEFDSALKEHCSRSLLEILFEDDSESPAVNQTQWTQPAIFAIQRGLTELLMSWGIKPDVVFGHSVGQYAAACVAGIMNWQDGFRLIVERGRLIGQLPADGKMLAVFAPVNTIEEVLSDFNDVSLAATNSTHVVISGAVDAVEEIESQLNTKGVRTKSLLTSHAFHSHLMDPVLMPFEKFANTIRFSQAQIPLVCNITGSPLSVEKITDGNYWANHIRRPVRYAESIESTMQLGCDLILELGPQAVLTRMAAGSWPHPSETLISCLKHGVDDTWAIKSAVAAAYVQGVTPNFQAMYSGKLRQHVQLPTYPFQRRRFWGPDKPRAFHAQYHTAHPLLGSPVALAGTETEKRYESFIDRDSPAWLPDHKVVGSTVMPGAGFIEMAIQVAENRTIENLKFENPLRPTNRTALQTLIRPRTDDREVASAKSRIEIFSLPAETKSWVRHCSADVVDSTNQTDQLVNRDEILNRCLDSETPENFYQLLNDTGLSYGPNFQVVRELHYSQNEVLARLQVNGDVRGYTVPPTLLDGALHSLAVGISSTKAEHLFLPVGIGKVHCQRPISDQAWCYANWKRSNGNTRNADVVLFDDDGNVLFRMENLQVQRVSVSALRKMSGASSDRLVYRVDWKPFRFTPTPIEKQNWLIISADDHGNSSILADRINSSLLEVGHTSTIVGSQSDQLWKVLDSKDEKAISGICWLVDSINSDRARAECRRIVDFLQLLLEQGIRSLECGIQFVTTNAVSPDHTSGRSVDPNATMFWGIGRVLGAEQPGLRCRLIDVEVDELIAESTETLIREILLTPTEDNQLSIRSNQIFVPRLSSEKLTNSGNSFKPNENGCYLITGGLGQLGRLAAHWLAKAGARQLVLVSRTSPGSSRSSWIKTIEELGCEVIVHPADMSDRKDVLELFEKFGNEFRSLSGVVHAAGVLDDGLIETQTWQRFENVLAPKLDAACLLHEQTQDLDLDLFILYSSAASILGSPGQSNYATGNAYLDGLAWHRRQIGLPAISINWGPWSAGMADDKKLVKRLALQGISPLSIDDAHSAMEKIIASDCTQSLVMDVDWRRMRSGTGGPALLSELVGSKKTNMVGDSALVKQLRRLTASAQRELIESTIQESLQKILATPEKPETDRPLIEMGLDSLMAVEFSTTLQEMLGEQYSIGPTMLFDHPTVDAITDHVMKLTSIESNNSDNSETSVPKEITAQPTAQEAMVKREDIAIIGVSCRFPGSDDVHQFWQNLLNGADSVRDIPEDRWDIERFYSEHREPGKMYARAGGFLDGIADFDAHFFDISEQEACWIDPQHRMLLENSYRALEDAGIATQPLADSNVGVFMGIMGQDYAFLPTLDDADVIRGFQGAGLSHSAGVGRISYMFGFEGPSVAVDTASSSSLVAVFQAMRSLQDRNCNLALAGGVNAILAPVNSLLMSKAGLLSPDGRCKSFSKDADGFGRGEGCGVVVLKRLGDAQRDGDRIMAVIRGGAVVHNGFSGGITSPNSKAQARVIDAAIKDAGIAPAQVQYLEAHGTGTEYGDPMEVGAAASIYGKGRTAENPLLIGSVKANISHLEAAGGASGLIKTVLSIYHGIIPKQIHCEQPNPHIPWQRMPLKIVAENTTWPDGERLAGITALGLVGTNAHLIVGSPTRENTKLEPADAPMNLMVCSARSKASLLTLANRYLMFLRNHPTEKLADVCYTTGVGRKHHEYRLAIAFADRNDLLRQLTEFDGRSIVETDLQSQRESNFSKENGRIGLHVHFDLPSSVSAGKSPQNPKLSWLFPDVDCASNQLNSLKRIFDTHSVVRDFIAEADLALAEHFGSTSQESWSLQRQLVDPTSQTAKPAVEHFLLQASLAKLSMKWGIEADAALGLGFGHYTAACAAGCLSFLDALILVADRERGLQKNVDDWNSFDKLANTFNYYPPSLPLVCSMTGDTAPIHRSLGGSYWRAHVHAEICRSKSVETLRSMQCDDNLIFGNTFPETSGIFWLDKTASENCLQEAIGKLYVAGYDVNFDAVYERNKCRPVSLPVYPFEKKRYWITEISKHMDKATQEVSS